MTTTIVTPNVQTYTPEEIARMEAQADDNWVEQFEVNPAEQAAKRAEFERLAALADKGTTCLVCCWRPMAQAGELGYGQGLCESCADLGHEQHHYR